MPREEAPGRLAWGSPETWIALTVAVLAAALTALFLLRTDQLTMETLCVAGAVLVVVVALNLFLVLRVAGSRPPVPPAGAAALEEDEDDEPQPPTLRLNG